MKVHRGGPGSEPGGITKAGSFGPGKRTLVETIQRRAAGSTNRSPSSTAPATAGQGAALPAAVQAKMGHAFGFDFSAVRVHEGEQAESLGALAYAHGSNLHFAPGQYDPHSARGQELIGHELAHVVQQREGRVAATTQLKGEGLNDDSSLEREADAWGARAARGEPVGRPAGGAADATSGPVQCFKDFSPAGSKDSKGAVHWANSIALRVAEDGTAAIAQARLSGSKEMYVLGSRLPGINAELATVHAPLRLVKDAGSVTGAEPGDLEHGAHTLDRVKPVDAVDTKIDKTIPDDCGDAARTVTGTFADGKQLHAEYNDKAGKQTHTANIDPEMMKYEIMVNHFSDRMPHAKTVLTDVAAALAKHRVATSAIAPHVAELNTLRKKLDDAELAAKAVLAEFAALKAAHDARVAAIASDAPDRANQRRALDDSLAAAKAKLAPRITAARTAYADADAKYKAFLSKDVGGMQVSDLLKEYFDVQRLRDDLIAEIMGPYLAMSPLEQDGFARKAGIDRYADPSVGEAYTISSGGKDKPGKSTWNFHWAGVIFKSTTGSDNITMENYAGNARSEWRLQMYGVPTKDNSRAGQTFHEQHRDAHGQHGETPTTMATEKA